MNGSSLRSRLRDLVSTGTRPTMVGAEPAVPRSIGHVTEVLGGTVCEVAGGCCVVVDRWYTPDSLHGDLTVGFCAESVRRNLGHLSVLGAAPGGYIQSAEPTVQFFDLETTGLAGGAGTYAFLVGFGAFVNDSFRTRQFFLTGYGIEGPLLRAVADWMTTADVLVSFNGRAFDASVLETRYLFQRLPVPFSDMPHVDMLHASRRLWSGGEGCSLRSLEETLVGVSRNGDIPGSEIPARYVQYVRTGDARVLVPVFEHNRLDLLSLASLTSIAVRLVEDGARGTRDARECLGLGRLFERVGLNDRATACYARAATDRTPGAREVRVEALRRLARRLRRERRHSAAADAWQQILALGAAEQAGSPARQPRWGALAVTREAVHALAVHHEHRLGDLHTARSFAVRAITAAASDTHRTEARHRLARLDRKLGMEHAERGRALFEG